jgi:hypothetical protein
VEGLAAIGCFPFVIEGFFPTEPGEIEFQVRLRAVCEGDSEIGSSIELARLKLPSSSVCPSFFKQNWMLSTDQEVGGSLAR